MREAAESSIMDAVQRLISSVILFNHTVAETVGLGASDLQFLTLLQMHGSLTPGQLAEMSNLRTGTVTGVLDRLERAGFVRRDRSADDRRKVIVSLEIENMMAKVGPLYQGQAESLFSVLSRYSTDELHLIERFLNDVNTGPTAAG
jgi:DNA-binding MarR family transcriptional regulator